MGKRTNTNRVAITPIVIEVLIISENLSQPPLGSISIPMVDASKNMSPIKKATNMCDHRLPMPTKRIISDIPIAKVPIGINRKAPH